MDRKILIIFVIILSYYSARSAVITGVVSDKDDNTPLVGTSVRIEGTGFGAIADRMGRYKINRVPAGNYSLLVSIIGYQTQKKPFSVRGDDTVVIDLSLGKQPLQTGEVVVSASKRVQSVQDVPITISTIDSRVLRERNITKLDDALLYVPGVSLNGDHVSVRGSSGFAFGTGSRVALLLDGFPLLSGDNADMKFDMLPLFEVERVEVVKGAGSALYGTSALGGVINIVTKEPDETPDYHFRAFSGVYTKPRYQSWEYSPRLHKSSGVGAGFSQKMGDFGIDLSGAWFGNESYRLYDDSYRVNLFTKMSYSFSGNTDLTLTGIFANEDKADWVYWSSLDSATRPPATADYDNRLFSRKINAIGELKHIFNDHHFIVVRSGLFNTYFKNSLNENDPQYRESMANSINSEIQMNSRASEKLLFTYGWNYVYNKVTSKTYGDNDQQIFSAYVQGETSYIPDITLTAGGRFDIEKTSDLDAHMEFSPKLGLSYATPYGVQMRASFGRGFRAPAVAERYASVAFQGFTVVPNLGLNPEISYSYEIGANYPLNIGKTSLIFDVAAFENDLSNLIEPSFVSAASSEIQFQNVTRARIRGLELDVKSFLFGAVGLETSLTAMDPRDLDSNTVLKYRSKFLWYTRLFLPIGPVELQADYRYISRVETIDNSIRLQVKDSDARVDAHVVDAHILFNMSKIIDMPFTLSVNANNLFDYYYTEMVGNLAPTRLITLQVEYGM